LPTASLKKSFPFSINVLLCAYAQYSVLWPSWAWQLSSRQGANAGNSTRSHGPMMLPGGRVVSSFAQRFHHPSKMPRDSNGQAM
jgi:hypothetical protein